MALLIQCYLFENVECLNMVSFMCFKISFVFVYFFRCYGTMGSGHTYNVPSGLLENMVKGTEVLPGHRRHLLSVVHRGVHLFPLCRHLPQTISQRSHQSVPVMCVELHEFKVGISAGPIFSSISQRICRHRHPQ